MTDNIKLPLLPVPMFRAYEYCDGWRADVTYWNGSRPTSATGLHTDKTLQAYALEAVRLNVGAVPDERKAFEAWAKPVVGTAFLEQSHSGVYRWNVVEDRWKCWQARAALSASPAPEPQYPEGCAGLSEFGMTIDSEDAAPEPQGVPANWVPITQDLLDAQEPWLYKPCWLALKSGVVEQGVYEWRQGRNPDRFRTLDGGDIWALDAAYAMPMEAPKHPGAEPQGVPEPIPEEAPYGYCPFCGSDCVARTLHKRSHVAECQQCFARGPQADTAQAAFSAWRERYTPQERKLLSVTPGDYFTHNASGKQFVCRAVTRHDYNGMGSPVRVEIEFGGISAPKDTP